MTKTVNTNHTGLASPANSFNRRISADTDQFDRNDIDALGMALDTHDHDTDKGLGIARIQTSATPSAAGQVQITGNDLKWWAGTAGAVYTAPPNYVASTWTPVLTAATPGDLSVAYTTQIGYYTTVGRMVFIIADILTSTFTHTTASGQLQITGVPVASLTQASIIFPGTASWGGITKANYTEITPYLGSASSKVLFLASGSAQAAADVNITDLPTTGTINIRISIAYMSA